MRNLGHAYCATCDTSVTQRPFESEENLMLRLEKLCSKKRKSG